jgi:hypothetical protein
VSRGRFDWFHDPLHQNTKKQFGQKHAWKSFVYSVTNATTLLFFTMKNRVHGQEGKTSLTVLPASNRSAKKKAASGVNAPGRVGREPHSDRIS